MLFLIVKSAIVVALAFSAILLGIFIIGYIVTKLK